MSVGSLTALVVAIASLAGTIPAIIFALRGNNKSNLVTTKVDSVVQPKLDETESRVTANEARIETVKDIVNGHLGDAIGKT